MSKLEIQELKRNTVLYLFKQQHLIWVNPPYQRQSDIWTLDKKQLLMDSILNGFDIPKLYFREYTSLTPGDKVDPTYRYAIIDGKQRLTSIWQFMEGKFTLADDFKLISDPSVDARGLTYAELGKKHPSLLLEFDQTPIPVITIATDDDELIEEMFSRLNEAVALSAPEKRNAYGRPLPESIRRLVNHKFFTAKIPFSNSRYRHFDFAAKMLLFEEKGGVTDTKKIYLDEFVKQYNGRWRDESQRDATQEQAEVLESKVKSTLDVMTYVFTDRDSLLSSVGMNSVYYLLYRLCGETEHLQKFARRNLQQFEDLKTENRQLAERDIASAEYSLLEFDRLSQSPNDAIALAFRLKVLAYYLLHGSVHPPDDWIVGKAFDQQ